jgi:hypothetical protein
METAIHPWAVSPKDVCRSLLCSQKTGRKGLEKVYVVETTKLLENVYRKEKLLL